MTSDLVNGVCRQFTVDDVVCPPTPRKGLFKTAAVDNIDSNPSSATAKDSFHGTGISMLQHPTRQFSGHERGVLLSITLHLQASQLLPYQQSIQVFLQKY